MNRRASPHLAPATIARARELRRDMTQAERILRTGLRAALPEARFRSQVPLGPYFADFASHRARLVVELDGSHHAAAVDYDAARTTFLEGQGYRVLRFWNGEVLNNLDGVVAAIAAHCPCPLVGEGGPKARMGGARRSRAPAHGAGTPTPRPPHKGEGAYGQPPVGVR